jgi:hypothetical protein
MDWKTSVDSEEGEGLISVVFETNKGMQVLD